MWGEFSFVMIFFLLISVVGSQMHFWLQVFLSRHFTELNIVCSLTRIISDYIQLKLEFWWRLFIVYVRKVEFKFVPLLRPIWTRLTLINCSQASARVSKKFQSQPFLTSLAKSWSRKTMKYSQEKVSVLLHLEICSL